jgi:hypothetical protein
MDIVHPMRRSALLKVFFVILLSVLPSTARGDSRQTEAVAPGQEVSFSTPNDHKKIMLGEVEDIVLLPWSITLPARIDTGAALSALDAREVSVWNNLADFKLGKRYGGLKLQLPIVGWREVRTALGSQKRPVVEIAICLGPKLIRTLTTLSDRSQMTYPFLVGRSVLNGSFMVDPSRSRAVEPTCLLADLP